MNYKTRKRIWPVSFVAALGVVAMLALLTVYGVDTGLCTSTDSTS